MTMLQTTVTWYLVKRILNHVKYEEVIYSHGTASYIYFEYTIYNVNTSDRYVHLLLAYKKWLSFWIYSTLFHYFDIKYYILFILVLQLEFFCTCMIGRTCGSQLTRGFLSSIRMFLRKEEYLVAFDMILNY